MRRTGKESRYIRPGDMEEFDAETVTMKKSGCKDRRQIHFSFSPYWEEGRPSLQPATYGVRASLYILWNQIMSRTAASNYLVVEPSFKVFERSHGGSNAASMIYHSRKHGDSFGASRLAF